QLYPAGVYAPLPRFSKNTQTNSAPSATRKTASARSSRGAVIVCVASVSKISPSCLSPAMLAQNDTSGDDPRRSVSMLNGAPVTTDRIDLLVGTPGATGGSLRDLRRRSAVRHQCPF